MTGAGAQNSGESDLCDWVVVEPGRSVTAPTLPYDDSNHNHSQKQNGAKWRNPFLYSRKEEVGREHNYFKCFSFFFKLAA